MVELLWYILVLLPCLVNGLNAGEGWKIGVIVGTTIGALVFACILLFFLYYIFVKKYIDKNHARNGQMRGPGDSFKKAPLYQLDAGYLPQKDYRQQPLQNVQIPEIRPSSLPDYGRSSVVMAGPTGGGSMTLIDQYDREPGAGSHNHSILTSTSYSSQPQGPSATNRYSDPYSNQSAPAIITNQPPAPSVTNRYSDPYSNQSTPAISVPYSNLSTPALSAPYNNPPAPAITQNPSFNSQSHAPVITDSPSYSSQVIRSPSGNNYSSESYTNIVSKSPNTNNNAYSYGQVRSYRETMTSSTTRHSGASYVGSSV